MQGVTNFLGVGWSFPPSFDRAARSVRMLSGVEDIESSLRILFSTTIGERVMQPDYGCNLRKFLFEPMNVSMTTYIKKLVEDAILYFEPRIKLDSLDLEVSDGVLNLKLNYTVKSTNSRQNMVYPFKLSEASTQSS